MRSLCALLFCFPVFLTLLADAQQTAGPAALSTAATLDSGAITGTVTDAAGALVPGARVVIVEKSTKRRRTAITAADGRFKFPGVEAGTFTLSVTADGLQPTAMDILLQDGELLEVPDIALRVGTANTDVEVRLTREEIAEEDMHAAEKQRLAGFVPNFYVVYDWTAPPLSTKQKFKLAARTIVDPANFVIVGGIAGVEQAETAFAGYGQGAAGYAKRYGAGFSDFSIGTVLGGAILPVLFRQDPRYFYKGSGSNRSRARYALSTGVIARGDNGKWEPAYAAVLGDFGSGALSNLYYPAGSRNGVSTTLENGFVGIAVNSLGNLIQEFFFKRITSSSNKVVTQAP
jgi:hypothetical protein